MHRIIAVFLSLLALAVCIYEQPTSYAQQIRSKVKKSKTEAANAFGNSDNSASRSAPPASMLLANASGATALRLMCA